MANPNTPFGLVPVRHYMGGVERLNEYNIADAYATSLFMGDPVLVTGTGKNIGIATAGSSGAVTGVFWGCKYVKSDGDTVFSKHWPASTATKAGSVTTAFVYDDPFILYAVQFDVTGFVAAGVRQLADLVAGAGDAATGKSGWYATYAAGSENQLKVLDLAQEWVHSAALVNVYGAYAVGLVMLGKPELVATAPVEV